MAESRHEAPVVSPLTMSCLSSAMKRQLSLTHDPRQSTLFRRDRMTLTPSGNKSTFAKKLELLKQQLNSIEKSFKAWSESTEAIARRRSRLRQDVDESQEEDDNDWNGFASLRPPEVQFSTPINLRSKNQAYLEVLCDGFLVSLTSFHW